MKKSVKTLLFFIAFGLMLANIQPVKAQCAQCAATVASNAKNGNTTTAGLNSGILFLLAAPYLAVGIAGFVWYRKYRRKKVSLDIRTERLHLN